MSRIADFDSSVLDKIPQWNEASHLNQPLIADEIHCAIKKTSGRLHVAHSIPPEIYQKAVKQRLQNLY
jgi:hypothetical protein